MTFIMFIIASTQPTPIWLWAWAMAMDTTIIISAMKLGK